MRCARVERYRIFQSTRPSRASTHGGLIRHYDVTRFQSTRPSRASTDRVGETARRKLISIHKALAGLDLCSPAFQAVDKTISIHKALAGLDKIAIPDYGPKRISIHKALAGLDSTMVKISCTGIGFQSTRPSRASTFL